MVMKTLNITYYQAVRLIKKHETSVDLVEFVETEIEEKPVFEEYDKTVTDKCHSQLLSSDRAKDYFKNRKINEDSIDTFNLGYSEKQDMVIVPVHTPEGMCIGFVARSITGKEFKNTPGLPRNKVLFNIHRVDNNEVVVVESSFDAIRLHQLGIPAIATLGSKISKQQVALLDSKFSDIVIMSDNDDAGRVLADSIKKHLSHKFIRQVEWASGIKDVGDLEDNQILETYKNAKDILNIMLGE